MRKFFCGACLSLLFLLLICVSVPAASTKVCKVTFQNHKGTSKSAVFQKLGKSVKAGSTITLPKISIKGYRVYGWTTSKGKSSPLYKMGSKYKIQKDTCFYLVSKRIVYTVDFYSNAGKTSKAYSKLQLKAYYGQTVTLPRAPALSGYRRLGWTGTAGSGTVKYAHKSQIKITKSLRLYAVYRKQYKVTFYSRNGKSIYETKTIDAGETCTFPSIVSPKGYTFLGWSSSPNQRVSPKYIARQTVRVNKALKFYAVCYPVSQEQNLANLPVPDPEKYTKVIFVGDSRTYQAQCAFQALYGLQSPVFQNVEFVAKSGSGLAWLKSTGYPELLNKVGEGGTEQKPIAVIFNHGVNDLSPANVYSDYVTTMKKIAEELGEKHVVLYYMSVNPMNRMDYEDAYKETKKNLKYEDRVLTINQVIKSGLCTSGPYHYIDCYQYLMKNGFSYNSGKKLAGTNTGGNDGIHYTVQTYKRIYAYCIHVLNSV